MSYEQIRQDIEARYQSGLLQFWERDEMLAALDYELGEAMTAADIERGIEA